MLAAHEERFGRLDVLVNNAGVAIQAPVERRPFIARRGFSDVPPVWRARS